MEAFFGRNGRGTQRIIPTLDWTLDKLMYEFLEESFKKLLEDFVMEFVVSGKP